MSADWHCHLLPGLDDGPAAMDESLEMAASLRKAGLASVYCTPHLIKGCFDADNGAVQAALAALQASLKDENIDLRLLPGREYYLDEFLSDYLKKPLPLGQTKYILLEISQHIAAEVVRETCFWIKRIGFIPMIAHPERCSLFGMAEINKTVSSRFPRLKVNAEDSAPGEPSLWEYLKDLGCAFQGNLGSFAGWYGLHVQQVANKLQKAEIYTHFGTDAHSIRGVHNLGKIDRDQGYDIIKNL